MCMDVVQTKSRFKVRSQSYDSKSGQMKSIQQAAEIFSPPRILSVSTDLKTLGDARINFEVTPFQMLGVVRVPRHLKPPSFQSSMQIALPRSRIPALGNSRDQHEIASHERHFETNSVDFV